MSNETSFSAGSQSNGDNAVDSVNSVASVNNLCLFLAIVMKND